MAFPSTTIFDYQYATGSNNYGIIWNSAASGVDHSTDATPYWTATDAVSNGTTTVNFPSGTSGHTLDANCAGNGLNFNGVVYLVVSFTDVNNCVVDRAIGATTGATVNIGGTGAIPTDAHMALQTAGNSLYTKKDGDTTLTSNLVASTDGTATEFIKFRGYNTTHDDCPTGTDRPTIACGIYYLEFNGRNYCEYSDFIVSGTHSTYCLYVGQNTRHENLKVEINGTGTRGIASSLYLKVIECEFSGSATSGHGVYSSAYFFINRCYFHDFGGAGSTGITCGATISTITGCVFDTLAHYGISCNQEDTSISSNTFYNITDTGVHIGSSGTLNNVWIGHNIFDTCGIAMGTTPTPRNQNIWNDFNNFTNNTLDLSGWTYTTLGANSTYNAVNFVDAAGGDFTPDMDSLVGVTGTNVQGAVDKAAGGGGAQVGYIS